MTDRDRISRIRESIHYSNLFAEETFFYRVSKFFSEQSNQSSKKSVFSTRLNCMKKILNTQNQIIQKKFYRSKAFDFSNSLLKHDISDSKSKKDEKDENSQKIAFEDSHTSTRENDFQITSSIIKIRRRSRHRQFHRRFIIELEFSNQEITIAKKETMNLYFRLVDKDVKSSISLVVKNIDEFKKSVVDRSADWMQNIFMLFDEMDLIKKLRQKTQQEYAKANIQLKKQKRQNIAQIQKFFDFQFRLTQTKNQLLFNQTVNKDLAHQKMKTVRMKRCRDQHRARENELAEKIKTLRLNKAVLKKKILNFINRQARQKNFIDDSDQKDIRREFRRQNLRHEKDFIELLSRDLLRKSIILFQKRIFERFHESTFSKKHSLILRTQHEHKIKYQNISNFYENHDEWKQWKAHLKIKLESDSWQFSNERNKIYYARNHCKKLIWDIIEHRVDYDSAYSYEFIEKLINDLKNVCDDFDKMNNAYNEFFENKFFMKFKNKNEIFEQYLNRFNNLMTSLNLIDAFKINQLFKIIIKRLTNAMTHLSKCKNYHRFVREMRAITHQKKILNDIDRHFEFKISKIFKIRTTSTISRVIKNKVANTLFTTRVVKDRNAKYNLSQLFSHVINKLKIEKKCYKCFKFDHRVNEQNAPCKNQKSDSKKKTIVELAKLDVKWDEMKAEKSNLLNDEFFESIDDEQKNWKFLNKVVFENFSKRCANESNNSNT